MIFPELNSIKERRQKIGIKQKEFASLCNVSQSMITKLETSKLEPSYSAAQKIFQTLESLEHKKEKTCAEIMTRKLSSLKKTDTVRKASEIMKKQSISQIPVMENKRVLGSLSESTILNNLLKINKEELFNMKIFQIMEGPYPIVNSHMPISVVIPMLKASQALLVNENGEINGIITKSNLI